MSKRAVRRVLRSLLAATVLASAPLIAQDDDGMPEGDSENADEPNAPAPSAPEQPAELPAPAGDDTDIAAEDEADGSFTDEDAEAPAIEMPLTPLLAARKARHYADLSYALPSEPFTAVAVDPGDPEVILAGSDGFLFKSDDGGESWRPVLSFARGLPPVQLNITGNSSVGVADQTSIDGTASPTDEDDEDIDIVVTDPDDDDANPFPDGDEDDDEELPDGDADFGEFLPDGNTDVAVGRTRLPRQDAGVRAIRFAGPRQRTVWVGTPRGLFRSRNNGESFASIELPGGADGDDVRDIAVDADDPSRVFVATRLGLLLTQNGGISFRRAPGRPGAVPALAVIAVATGGDRMVVVGLEEGILRSWDGGKTYRELLLKGVSPFEPVTALAFDVRDEVTWVGTARGLFVSERRAAIFERRSDFSNQAVVAVSVDGLRPGGAAIATLENGLFFVVDTGISVVDVGDVVPAADVYDIARPGIDSDALIIATDRGVFEHKEGSGISVSTDRMRWLRREWKAEPTLAEMAEAALHYQGMHPVHFRSFSYRAGVSAMAPRMQAFYRYSMRRRRTTPDARSPVQGADEFGDVDDPDFQERIEEDGLVDAPSNFVVHEAFVLFEWDLDRVLFNTDELTVARFMPQRQRTERRIVNRVSTLYGARRRLLNLLVLDETGGEPRLYANRMLRLQEITAQIDATTGGAFLQTARKRGAQIDEDMLPVELEGKAPRKKQKREVD